MEVCHPVGGEPSDLEDRGLPFFIITRLFKIPDEPRVAIVGDGIRVFQFCFKLT
jgi:hypothetical protein